MWAVYRKELRSYFYSPIAYVLIGLFILLTSIFFFLGNLASRVADFSGIVATMGFILVFIIPVLTMRILAEDRKNGTEVLLLTSPSRLSGIVIGKFLAAFTVFLILTVLTFVYPVIIVLLGGKITAQLVGSYIGFILLGASFISVGVFASSITENQVVAVIVGFVSLLVMWIIDSLAGFIGGFAGKVLSWFSLLSRYEDFNKGILSLSPIVYYISFTAVFIFITIQMIEKRRWSQG